MILCIAESFTNELIYRNGTPSYKEKALWIKDRGSILHLFDSSSVEQKCLLLISSVVLPSIYRTISSVGVTVSKSFSEVESPTKFLF